MGGSEDWSFKSGQPLKMPKAGNWSQTGHYLVLDEKLNIKDPSLINLLTSLPTVTGMLIGSTETLIGNVGWTEEEMHSKGFWMNPINRQACTAVHMSVQGMPIPPLGGTCDYNSVVNDEGLYPKASQIFSNWPSLHPQTCNATFGNAFGSSTCDSTAWVQATKNDSKKR